jgi:hypothetical protein
MHPKSRLAVRVLPLVVSCPCQLAMVLVLEVHFAFQVVLVQHCKVVPLK